LGVVLGWCGGGGPRLGGSSGLSVVGVGCCYSRALPPLDVGAVFLILHAFGVGFVDHLSLKEEEEEEEDGSIIYK
jgi:hypothetical protein